MWKKLFNYSFLTLADFGLTTIAYTVFTSVFGLSYLYKKTHHNMFPLLNLSYYNIFVVILVFY